VVTILSEVVNVKLMEDHVTWSTHFDLQVKGDVHETEVTIKLFEIKVLTKRCLVECAHLDLFGKLIAVHHFGSFSRSFSGTNRRCESISPYKHLGKVHLGSGTMLCSEKL
jgi:hypothetical protein